jgi:hypothetical protein
MPRRRDAGFGMALSVQRRVTRILAYSGLGFIVGALALFPIGQPWLWITTGIVAAAFGGGFAALSGKHQTRNAD